MSAQELASLARKHWAEWLPEKTAELKAAGEFFEATQGAAQLAQDEIDRLMSQGYQEHEAREVALQLFVLLPPEESEPDELDQEIAEREAAYQKIMAKEREIDERED